MEALQDEYLLNLLKNRFIETYRQSRSSHYEASVIFTLSLKFEAARTFPEDAKLWPTTLNALDIAETLIAEGEQEALDAFKDAVDDDKAGLVFKDLLALMGNEACHGFLEKAYHYHSAESAGSELEEINALWIWNLVKTAPEPTVKEALDRVFAGRLKMKPGTETPLPSLLKGRGFEEMAYDAANFVLSSAEIGFDGHIQQPFDLYESLLAFQKKWGSSASDHYPEPFSTHYNSAFEPHLPEYGAAFALNGDRERVVLAMRAPDFMKTRTAQKESFDSCVAKGQGLGDSIQWLCRERSQLAPKFGGGQKSLREDRHPLTEDVCAKYAWLGGHVELANMCMEKLEANSSILQPKYLADMYVEMDKKPQLMALLEGVKAQNENDQENGLRAHINVLEAVIVNRPFGSQWMYEQGYVDDFVRLVMSDEILINPWAWNSMIGVMSSLDRKWRTRRASEISALHQ